jgi:signal transduction histidine kinase
MVCKGIISDHGGSIGVVSTPGTGTEFQIALPVPEGTEEAAEVKEG